MNYYRRFPGDYLRDTMDLNLLQHGAYTLLLDCLYSTEKPIPSEESAFNVCKARTEEERWAVTEILQKFFKKTVRGFTQKRFEELLKERNGWRKRQKDHRLRSRDIAVTVTAKSNRNPLSTHHSPLTTIKKEEETTIAPNGASEFELFYEAYPVKKGRQKAREAWSRLRLDGHVGEVLVSIRAWSATRQWTEGYIPWPQKFLNQGLWKESPGPERGNGQGPPKKSLEAELRELEARSGTGRPS